jgi:hypothetical protein
MQIVPGGEYDNYGFYYIPDGSFWDPDGIYFNKDGYDCHGGYYSENLEYCPGPGWIDELMCYEDEKQEVLKKMGINANDLDKNENDNYINADEYDEEGDLDEDNFYDEIDYEKLLEAQYEKLGILESKEEENLEKETRIVYIPGKSMNVNVNINTNNKKNMGNNKVFTKINEENEFDYLNDLDNSNSSDLFDYNNTNTNTNTNINTNTNTNNNHDSLIKKAEVITSDQLFNKIPDNLKPNYVKDNENNNDKEKEKVMTKVEKTIDIDSLFG